MATYRLDVLGEMCPGPLIKAEARLRRMAPGDVLIMSTDHNCTARALKEYLRRLPCRFTVRQAEDGVWDIEITRK